MIATILSLASLIEDSPKQAFQNAMSNYSKMTSFSADLVHDHSSGLFPGKYEQHLDFVKGKGFKLVVTGLKGTRPSDCAPDYFCDGKDVTTIGRNEGTRALNQDANISPGYEVSGGLILTWLLESPNKDIFNNPPNGVKFNFSWGKDTSWHSQKVSEIVVKVEVEKVSNSVSIFFDPEQKQMVGFEYVADKQTGWMMYKNQKQNPSIDPSSFKPPKN